MLKPCSLVQGQAADVAPAKARCSVSAKMEACFECALHEALLDLLLESITLVQLHAAEWKGPAP